MNTHTERCSGKRAESAGSEARAGERESPAGGAREPLGGAGGAVTRPGGALGVIFGWLSQGCRPPKPLLNFVSPAPSLFRRGVRLGECLRTGPTPEPATWSGVSLWVPVPASPGRPGRRFGLSLAPPRERPPIPGKEPPWGLLWSEDVLVESGTLTSWEAPLWRLPLAPSLPRPRSPHLWCLWPRCSRVPSPWEFQVPFSKKK